MFYGAVCCKGPGRKENRHGVRGLVRPRPDMVKRLLCWGVDGVTECDGWNTHISLVPVDFSMASHVRHFLLSSRVPAQGI